MSVLVRNLNVLGNVPKFNLLFHTEACNEYLYVYEFCCHKGTLRHLAGRISIP